MRYVFIFALSVFLVLSPPAARAAPDAAGAAALEKEIGDALSWYRDLSDFTGNGITYKGAVTVTPKDTHYEVRAAGVALVTAAGFSADLGTVVANARKGDDGAWLFSIALPETVVLRDAAQEPVADIRAATQRFSAAWLPGMDVMHKYDAEYGNITITPRGEGAQNVSLVIGSLRAARNMKKNGDGTWTGPQVLGMDDIRFSAGTEDNGMKGAAAKISSREEYERATLGLPAEFKDKLRALADRESMTPETARRLALDIVKDAMQLRLPHSVTALAEISGVSMDMKRLREGAENPDITGLSVEKAGVYSEMIGTQSEKGRAGMRLTVEGLHATGIPENLAGLVPTSSNIELHFDDVPMSKLAEAFGAIMTSATAAQEEDQSPEDGQQAEAEAEAGIRNIVLGLPAEMAKAGASFSIRDTHITAPDIEAHLDGRLAAAPASPLRVAGSFTFALHKLDEWIRAFQQSTSDPEILKFAQGAVAVQALGQMERGPNGESVRKYVVDITPDGRVLMNGSDMSMVAALLTGNRQPKGPPRMPPPQNGADAP